jgi:CHAD domain-containing protein
VDRQRLALEQHIAAMDSDSLVRDLGKLEKCFSRLDLGQFKCETLLDSAKQSYREGRAALASLHVEPSTNEGHALRKHVKYLWYQMRLLQKADTVLIRQLILELEELGELLGQDHDLAVLADTLQGSPGICCNAVRCELIGGLIETRRIAILSAVLRLADRVYAAKPKRFLSALKANGLEKVSGTFSRK